MEQVNTRLPIYDLNGKVVDNIQLDEKIFDGQVNTDLLYEAKKMYENNTRQGNASTKTRADVEGGGKKPWRQKGTGRARVGSSRNPVWRHGGVTFGPKPRDLKYSMPKKALRKALLSGLNARLVEQMIKPVVKLEVKDNKTKGFKTILENLKVSGKILVVVEAMEDGVRMSSRNITKVSLIEERNLNVRDVLLNECIVIEKVALEKLSERLK
ncbi:MAG: 50S ribosomal protein L4 [Candidatus Omnitrophica bacterium]|nr:50S ribosomal protein L4 [Candidatus Omnitrophota bacterium]MDD5487397.1 50S ribosomal protein L4 [Candidatus Omnitrophota bacterium]